jgi:hypothetical protein
MHNFAVCAHPSALIDVSVHCKEKTVLQDSTAKRAAALLSKAGNTCVSIAVHCVGISLCFSAQQCVQHKLLSNKHGDTHHSTKLNFAIVLY